MGKKNICPRCGGPLRPDMQCTHPDCRMQTSDMNTPVVEPPEFSRPSNVPTEAPSGNPDSIETLPAEMDLESPFGECSICHSLMEPDGRCRNVACLSIQQAMLNVGNLNAFSEPPPADQGTDCIPPLDGGETPATDEPGWDDYGRCMRCNIRLEQGFSHCPKCGLARPRKADPYAALRNGLPASLPPGSTAPTKSGFQPKKSEYSYVDPDAINRRRRKL
ncbi:MAG: hypothetical protein WC551_04015 [Patescibacteria group bacterium]